MGIINLTVGQAAQVGELPRVNQLCTTDNFATITTPGYLNSKNTSGKQISPTDVFDVIYNYIATSTFASASGSGTGTYGRFVPVFINGIITLQLQGSVLNWVDVTATAAALATAGKVNVQIGSGSQQFIPRDLRVNYSASGLSGGGGDRLLVLTDGTTVYNNAGITAALLGTPVNTLLGGSGNPVAGTVSMIMPTVAGSNLYFQYSGGATDFTSGSVSLSVLIQRVS